MNEKKRLGWTKCANRDAAKGKDLNRHQDAEAASTSEKEEDGLMALASSLLAPAAMAGASFAASGYLCLLVQRWQGYAAALSPLAAMEQGILHLLFPTVPIMMLFAAFLWRTRLLQYKQELAELEGRYSLQARRLVDGKTYEEGNPDGLDG